MTSFFYLLVLVVGFILETSVRHLPLVAVRFDIGWIIVLFMGFYVPLFPGGLWVLGIGLAQESLGGAFHGILPLTYLLIYFILRLTHQHLFFERGFPQVVWVMILTFLQKGIEMGLLAWQGYGVVYRDSHDLLYLALTALVQGLLSLLLFPFLRNSGRMTWKSALRERRKVSFRIER